MAFAVRIAIPLRSCAHGYLSPIGWARHRDHRSEFTRLVSKDMAQMLLALAANGGKANRFHFGCNPTLWHRPLSCEKIFL